MTGAVLVLEMTASYTLLLPMIITCLGATIVAQWLGGRPLYTVLMEKSWSATAFPTSARNRPLRGGRES